ncbi:hypothetical protein PRK78_006732 [Emydomyces testavorans]|uniref:Protein kinase domain-containing protein n=1 Tax=Emydomyces testavorans TaxID=2070801 RepID=A0AAF0IM18_9EURO|nr:hypothetical protein PRK78_006732 [Emydomyces testavorans]
MLKILLQELFVALDYLHTETQVIHTGLPLLFPSNLAYLKLTNNPVDIQSKNIMVGTTDPSVFMEWDTLEQTEPSPRKVIGDRIVYKSRTFQWKDDFVAFGLPLLSDFGEARIGSGEHEGLIQPNQYRAPEVLLGMKWTSKVDIWNIGVMIWSLFEDHLLFDGAGPDGGFSDAYLLAEMISVLGPPPIKFLERRAWRGLPPIPENSLEDSEERLEGKNKELFMQFLRKMLTWMPEERFSAKELLQDEWLMRPRHNVNRPP